MKRGVFPTPEHQTGFTLLEALVALVIISIGLLGLLGLQTFAITATQGAQYRSLASIGAQDIAGRIQANPAGAIRGYYSPISPGTSASTDCRAQSCSPEAMARFDARTWQQALASALPEGRGFVDCARQASTSGTTRCVSYRVTIAWTARDRSTDQPATDLLCRDTTHGIEGACLVAEIAP